MQETVKTSWTVKRMNEIFPLSLPAIRVNQPGDIGPFYAVSISAELLCELTFSVKAMYSESGLTGTQRKLKEERTDLIAEYLAGSNCTFPNSIILGANFNKDGIPIIDTDIKWKIVEGRDGRPELVIPTSLKAASIIDGQHRIEGFKKHYTKSANPVDMELLCTIFFGVPAPVQAEIFATINYNQKPVDKSLAYQLFGYSLDQKSSDSWVPDSLALHFVRLLDREADSPFFGCIKSGAIELETRSERASFLVSTAAVVEGVVKLFSSNPVKDRYKLNARSVFRKGRKNLRDVRSTAPLRSLYLDNQDRKIYDIIVNFFRVCDRLLISDSKKDSKIRATIGISALFGVLRHILQSQGELKATEGYFSNVLEASTKFDFADNFFSTAGVGKTKIKNSIILVLNLTGTHHERIIERINEDVKEFNRSLSEEKD